MNNTAIDYTIDMSTYGNKCQQVLDSLETAFENTTIDFGELNSEFISILKKDLGESILRIIKIGTLINKFFSVDNLISDYLDIYSAYQWSLSMIDTYDNSFSLCLELPDYIKKHLDGSTYYSKSTVQNELKEKSDAAKSKIPNPAF